MARRRKTLSQNFLHSPSALQLVVRLAAPGTGDLVVEPGAGEGVLTRALARRGCRIVAHEVDPALTARLRARTRELPRVSTVRGDFLRSRSPREPFAVVGNIPFSRTSDIVRWCLEAPELTSATLVTQLEYARKRTGDYGRWSLLTVRTWPEYEWRLAARVARRHFTPAPRTDCAVVRLERRAVPLLVPESLDAYREFTAYGFTGVGGSLFATLRTRHPVRRVRAAFGALGLDEAVPVGEVSPALWLALFTSLHGHGAAHAPPAPGGGVTHRAGSAPRLPGSPRRRASRRG